MSDRPDGGYLSRNEKKQSETHPDFRGSMTLEGREFWISAWVAQNDRGKYFKLKFQPKQQVVVPLKKTPEPDPGYDDPLPF